MAAGGGATALHAAASAGHLAIVEALIQASADVDIQVTINTVAALYANVHGIGCKLVFVDPNRRDVSAEDTWECQGSPVHIQAQNGATALHNAAGGGFDAAVKALLAANADIDVQNTNCNTALHLAAGKGVPTTRLTCIPTCNHAL